MKSISLQVTYRKGRPSAAYIYFDRRPGTKSARTAELAPDIVVDFAPDDQPIGLEIVDPESVTVEDILAVFDQLGLARPDGSELAPLDAA
jgi:hypothetical protein